MQQAVEKAIKALLVYYDVEPPMTHSFIILLKAIARVDAYPNEIEKIIELEDYAVQTRYPGEYTPVDEAEYQMAASIAKNAVDWIKRRII